MNKITFITWIMHSNLTNKLESVKSEMYFYISALTIFKKLMMVLKQLLRSDYIPHQNAFLFSSWRSLAKISLCFLNMF